MNQSDITGHEYPSPTKFLSALGVSSSFTFNATIPCEIVINLSALNGVVTIAGVGFSNSSGAIAYPVSILLGAGQSLTVSTSPTASCVICVGPSK